MVNQENVKRGGKIKKKQSDYFFCILLFVTAFCLSFRLGAEEIKDIIRIPKAKIERYEKKVHGEVLVDNYHWIKDEKWPKVESKEILDYIKEENHYAESYFTPYKEQEEKIFKEIKERIIEEDEIYPKRFDNYYYYRKYKGNYFQVCRKKNSLKGKEEVILDVNKLAEGKGKGYKVGSIFPSPKHDKITYAEDLDGGERYSISVKNLKTGKVDSDVANNMMGSIIWHGNNKGFFYIKRDNKLRGTEVYYQELGKSQSKGKLIYKETNKGFGIDIKKTSDNKYLIIDSSTSLHLDNEIRILNIEKKAEVNKANLVLERKEGQEYEVNHRNDEFFLKINDQGKNFRLVKVQKDDFNNKEKWEEIIPHNDKELLLSYGLSKKYLMVNIRSNGINKILIFNKKGKKQNIEFDEEAYDAYGYFTTFDTELIRVHYTSFTTIRTVYDYDCKKNKLYKRKTQKVKGEYDREKYQSEKIYITADDGVDIPVSLFYRKDKFKKDGTNPLYLYGYGSYGISSFPYFDTNLFSLVDRGFVYAIAHIRGGSEQGYKWYEDAKLLTKKRTFLDYINCAEGLIKRKYGARNKIVGYGASAGGMLIGYVINEKPELLKVAIAEVPFVDTLNFMLDQTLPTAPAHYKELGDPKIKEYYEYIKSYSPYDNIKKQNYPAIYATAGISDRRVQYWQSVKWVAKLRHNNKGTNPILLHTNRESGHFGPSGKDEYLKQIARMYNYIFINIDIEVN